MAFLRLATDFAHEARAVYCTLGVSGFLDVVGNISMARRSGFCSPVDRLHSHMNVRDGLC
jgi:hypothetical protein